MIRVLFVADGRSPIARSWIESMAGDPLEVHLASTAACDAWPVLSSLNTVPVAGSGLRRGGNGGGSSAVGLRTRLRQWIGPLTIPRAAGQLQAVMEHVRPDLVHALRVPFEGMLAAAAEPSAPLILSTWGNDFTLHAASNPLMAAATRRAMRAAQALICDSAADVVRAASFGYPVRRPSHVLPGNGGLAPHFFEQVPDAAAAAELDEAIGRTEADALTIVNPRGVRAYVRNDTFFRSLPQIVSSVSRALIVCPAMAGNAEAQAWIDRYGLHESVLLLPPLSSRAMAELLRRTQIVVSISEHDGTPNTLLEAMASGAVPVAGDLPSLREWIEHGVNGRLVDADDPQALAAAVLKMADRDWLAQAAKHNRKLVRSRASRSVVRPQALELYQALATGELTSGAML